jgi:DNA polymerase III epsilon subunit-like protein
MTNSFVAIDFETANNFRGSPCSIGMVRVVDGQKVASYQKLVKPPIGYDFFLPMNVAIHGISEEDVSDAPRFSEIWPEVADFIGESDLVAHNAGFDMSVLRDSLTYSNIEWPKLNYYCTYVLSRRSLKLLSYRLPFVAEALEVSFANHHDALADSTAAAEIALKLIENKGVSSLGELAELLKISVGHISTSGWHGSQAKKLNKSSGLTKSEIDLLKEQLKDQIATEGELYGKNVAFTGALSTMIRPEAFELVVLAGGNPQDGVNKQTDLLVFGMQDASQLRPGAEVSSKYEKAQKLQAAGSAIEVIDEELFLAMLG